MSAPTHLAMMLLLISATGAFAQETTAPRDGNRQLLRRFDTNGDGVIDDDERRAARDSIRGRPNRPGATTPSGRTVAVGDRTVSELQYASSDGRMIPCVLSMPRGDGSFPVVVTIHGGQGDRDLAFLRTMAAPNGPSPTVSALNGRPWAVLAISYRGGDGAVFGTEHDDVIAGIRFAKTLPNVDGSRVGVLGGSHGGHLALVAAEKMGREIRCVVACSPWMIDPVVAMTGDPAEPPLSLVPEAARGVLVRQARGLFQGLMRNRNLSEREVCDLIARESIAAHIEKIAVPVLFVTSRGDDQAPHALIEPTIHRLEAAGGDVEVFTADKSPHGFYWARTASAARALRGEKTEEEHAEEIAAREEIVRFLIEHMSGGIGEPAASSGSAEGRSPAQDGAAESPHGIRGEQSRSRGASDGEGSDRR